MPTRMLRIPHLLNIQISSFDNRFPFSRRACPDAIVAGLERLQGQTSENEPKRSFQHLSLNLRLNIDDTRFYND